ncbi:hypothetical protein ACU19_01370, partial [Actinobaculum suis]
MGYSVRFACRVVGVSSAAYYNARKRHQQPSADKYDAVRGGRPRVLRMDTAPEFISHELPQWAAKPDTLEAFILPGM